VSSSVDRTPLAIINANLGTNYQSITTDEGSHDQPPVVHQLVEGPLHKPIHPSVVKNAPSKMLNRESILECDASRAISDEQDQPPMIVMRQVAIDYSDLRRRPGDTFHSMPT
jgi:hypothetical protein